MRVLIVGSGERDMRSPAVIWRDHWSTRSPWRPAMPASPRSRVYRDRRDGSCGAVGFAVAKRSTLSSWGRKRRGSGAVDALESEGIAAFGRSAASAALEGSKAFAKDLCARAQIPTASYRRFRDPAAAKAFIRSRGAPIVVKANGLAGGKGVAVARISMLPAARLSGARRGPLARPGRRHRRDFLAGEEASFFALVDGQDTLPLATAQDYERVGHGDTGLNTGGMGAISPSPRLTPALEGVVMERIVLPAVAGMSRAGCPFKGVLYAG